MLTFPEFKNKSAENLIKIIREGGKMSNQGTANQVERVRISTFVSIYFYYFYRFVIVTFFVVVFSVWWYYRYRYRPRHVVVGQSNGVVAQSAPGVVTAGDVNVIRVNAPYPTYPQAGPVTIMPGGSTVHYAAYPPPVYGPVQGCHPPPPAYTSVVNTGTTVTTTAIH